MPEFSIEEVNLLIKGLESLSKSHSKDHLLSTMIGVMASGSKEQAREELRNAERQMEQIKAKHEEESLRIAVLNGRLATMKLRILQEQPFAEIKEIHLDID